MKKFSNKLFLIAMLISTPVFATTFNVCEGENWERGPGLCRPYDAFTPCRTVSQKARELCQQTGSNAEPTVIVLQSVGGGECGYTSYRVICN